MGGSGLVDWQRLNRSLPSVQRGTAQHTYVYAYWLVDYGRRSGTDQGISLFKPRDGHPDWFIHADTADRVLAAYANPRTLVSPNFGEVFDNGLSAKPLLASMLVGTTNTVYHDGHDQLWWCALDDLTWLGRRVIRQIDRLYERHSILVTFVEMETDEDQRRPEAFV